MQKNKERPEKLKIVAITKIEQGKKHDKNL
jgi:hypothetical protein